VQISFEGSVSAVVQNYTSLVSVFLEETSGKALSLYKLITYFNSLYRAHFLSEVLKHLCVLSKAYQRADLECSEVNPLFQSTVGVIVGLKDRKTGSVLCRFLETVPAEPTLDECGLYKFEFEGHTIRDGAQQRPEAKVAYDTFVTNVVIGLRQRFSEDGDARVMSAMVSVFQPHCDVACLHC